MQGRYSVPYSLVFCLLAIIISPAIISAQSQNEKTKEVNLYSDLMDRVFPRISSKRLIGFGLVLRFAPSFGEESQININVQNNDVQVTEFKVVGKSIYDSLNDFIDSTGKEDLDAIIPTINVQKRSIPVSLKDALLWRSEFLKNLSDALESDRFKPLQTTNSVVQTDDGATFEIWYTADSQIYYKAKGIEPSLSKTDGKHHLINWMKQLKLSVNQRKSSVNQK